MSIYPAPNSQNNIFNEIDYNNETNNDECCNNNDDTDLSNYVKKEEPIYIPYCKFFDNTEQYSAFTNSLKTQIDTNTTNIQGVVFDNSDNYTKIDDLKTTNLKINNVLTQPFQSIDKNKIYQNEGNIILHNDRISALEAVNHTDDDSNYVEKNTALLNIPSITFSNNSVQNTAFTDDILLQIASNDNNINLVSIKTQNISFDYDNSYTTITNLKTDNNFMVNGEKYIDKMNAYDSKNLAQDINISDNRIDIDSNINSITNLRNDVDAINASNYDSELYQHDNRITSNLNAINSINNKLNNKIHIAFNFGFEVLGNNGFQVGGYSYLSDYIYRITDHVYLNPYTVEANGAAPRFFPSDFAGRKLMFKYSFNFTCGGSDLKYFYSRYNIYNNIPNEGSATLVNFSNSHGVDYDHHINFQKQVMYRDSFVIDLNGNNETVALYTKWDLKTSNNQLFMYGKIQIIEL